MGEVIPFRGKGKVQKNLDIEMLFGNMGIGINPYTIRAVQVTKNNNIYFVFEGQEYLGIDPDTPSCGLRCGSTKEALIIVRDLKEMLAELYDRTIEVYYDKGKN